MQFTHFIGIDISKATVDISLCDQTEQELAKRKVKNSGVKLVEFFSKLFVKHGINPCEVLLGCEATGRYTSSLKAAAVELGVALIIEPHWKYAQLHRSRIKSDRVDACRISRALCRDHADLHLWQPDSQAIERLRSMVSCRDMLIQFQGAMEVSIAEAHAAEDYIDYEVRKKYFRGPLRSVKAQIAKIDQDIDVVLKEDEEVQKNYELITSIPGMGRRNAIALIIYTQNFARFENARQIACYAGVAPFEDSSGTSRKKKARVSHKANKKLKSLLFLAALSAKRHNPKLVEFYDRKTQEGKHPISVLTAVANKLLHLTFAIIKNQEPYSEDYQAKFNSGKTT